jgi:hypothetical protein
MTATDTALPSSPFHVSFRVTLLSGRWLFLRLSVSSFLSCFVRLCCSVVPHWQGSPCDAQHSGSSGQPR